MKQPDTPLNMLERRLKKIFKKRQLYKRTHENKVPQAVFEFDMQQLSDQWTEFFNAIEKLKT